MSTIAFCGLGAIGAPMASHLAKAPFDLTVWNRTGSKASSFSETYSVRSAPTPRLAAEGRRFVITCLPESSDVLQILEGPEGLIAGMESGATLIDCTSGDPAISREIAAKLQAVGIGFIDAPVSGGVVGAESATLTVMCGCSAQDLEGAMPVLKCFGSRIVHVGPVGAGHALKAVNNSLLAMHLLGTAEGLLALTKAGVDPGLALEVINASSGRSNASEKLFPERVLNGAFPRTFRAALLDKDASISAAIARAERVSSPMLQLTAELWRVIHAELGEDADHVECVRVLEKWAGVEIRSSAVTE